MSEPPPQPPSPAARIQVDKRLLLLALLVATLGLTAVAGRWSAAAANLRYGSVRSYTECAYELPESQSFLLDEFACPAESCNDELLRCHCSVAHEIKTLVKEFLLLSRDTDQIRWEIRSRYGSALDP